MSKHSEIIQEKLRTIKLPQLPQVLIELIDLCRQEEVDIRLVAQTVAQDIAVTTKTLQLANSAFLGARSQFKNIDQAVIFLGIDTVRNLAISVSVHEVFANSKKSQSINREQFWYHCLLTALLSKTIAQKSGYDDPGAAYLTGLLHDTGKYLLAEHFGDKYQTLINDKEGFTDLVDAEEKAFGISHCDAGKWLLDSWNLSQEFGNAVKNHHNRDSQDNETSILSRIIRLANKLAKKSEAYDEQTERDASILCISPSSLSAMKKEQTTVLEDLAGTLGISIKEPESEQSSVAQEKTRQRLNDKIELRAQLYGFMDNIIQAQTMNRIFLALEESISLLFNCNISVLLVPNQDGGDLVVQGSFRNKAVKRLKEERFTLPAGTSYPDKTDESYLLVAINRCIVLSSGEKISPLDPLFKACDKNDLLAVPLRISAKRQGLLLLGLTGDNNDLQEQEEALQLLASHVGNRLYQEALKEEYAREFTKERITAVEEMARSVAHEISNPLGIIQNYITLLAEKAGQNQAMSQELSIINKEIERIADISKQLGDLSTAPQPTHDTLTDINKLITDTLNLFKNSLPVETGIRIDFEPPVNLPAVWMKTNPLKQILGNLITNSIDALKDSGSIEIHCHHIPETDTLSPGEIVITISDNGPGVPPSIVNSIFRAGTTTKADGHAGLGLAIVNKLVKDISGRIYHSTSRQGNTQFTIHFPVIVQAGA